MDAPTPRPAPELDAYLRSHTPVGLKTFLSDYDIMNRYTNLPKKITSKMNPGENTKHTKLRKEFKKLGDTMVRFQKRSTDYFRKHKKPTQIQVKKQQVLDDTGLKASYLYDKKGDELGVFRQKLRKKYK